MAELLDGGLSTQLEAMGYDITGPLWTARALLEDPTAITAAHRAYVDAGADIVITASYQASTEGLGRDASVMLGASVACARASGAAKVAASVGPYGAIRHDGSEYRGNYGLTRAELAAFHAPRIEALLEASPDLLAVETVPELDEIEAIADVLAGTGIPAWVSFSVGEGSTLASGAALADAVAAAQRIDGLIAVGANCLPASRVPDVLHSLSAIADVPLIAYPNGGGTWDPATSTWHGERATASAADVAGWLDEGAVIVGGCCGTDATVIAGYRDTVRDTARGSTR